MPKISGSKGVTDRLNRLAGKEKVALVGKALFVAGDAIKAHAQHSITQGAVSGKGHKPSRPGEPPNEDTAHLRTNIFTTQPAPLRVLVSSEAKYSAALEYGTSKMAARPFMGPAARAKRAEVVALVNKAISFATNKG